MRFLGLRDYTTALLLRESRADVALMIRRGSYGGGGEGGGEGGDLEAP